MDNIFFSILIPNLGLNGKSFRKCIESALSQKTCDLFSYEIIICDQSDIKIHSQLKEIILSVDYSNKIIIFNPKFKSLFLARHFLIQKSKGKYVVFLDSDDYIEQDYLSSLYNILHNSSIDMLIVDLIFEKSDGHIIKKTSLSSKEKNNIVDTFIYSNSINSVSRKIFLRSKYYKEDYTSYNYTIGEDKMFSYPIIKRCNGILYFPISKYHYVQNNDSMMGTLSFESFLEYLSNTIIDSDLKCISRVGKSFFSIFLLDSFLNSAIYVIDDSKLRLRFDMVFQVVYNKLCLARISLFNVARAKRKILFLLIYLKQKKILFNLIWKKAAINKNG